MSTNIYIANHPLPISRFFVANTEEGVSVALTLDRNAETYNSNLKYKIPKAGLVIVHRGKKHALTAANVITSPLPMGGSNQIMMPDYPQPIPPDAEFILLTNVTFKIPGSSAASFHTESDDVPPPDPMPIPVQFIAHGAELPVSRFLLTPSHKGLDLFLTIAGGDQEIEEVSDLHVTLQRGQATEKWSFQAEGSTISVKPLGGADQVMMPDYPQPIPPDAQFVQMVGITIERLG